MTCFYYYFFNPGKNTVKYNLGVSPAGLIIHISSGYGGKASDKHIFLQEGVLQQVNETNYALMVDKGFAIVQECNSAGVKVHIPAKKKGSQFSKDVAIHTRNVASARVHVERVIGRLRQYSIMRQPIKTHLFGCTDMIVRICCGLVNLQTPVLADDKFLPESVEIYENS